MNVSIELLQGTLQGSEVTDLNRALAMIQERRDELGTFLSADEKGKHLPDYLLAAGETLASERDEMLDVAKSLAENVDHIKTIVSMQQSYTQTVGVVQEVSLASLLDDAIALRTSSFSRHKINVIREYEELPDVSIDSHKVFQAIVNLIKNAKEALTEGEDRERKLWVRLHGHGEDRVRIQVIDNGPGITEEHLTKIFTFGFTTKPDGHGYGLHGCANVVNEVDGTIWVESDGPGKGASFTVELPTTPVKVTT